MAGVVGEIFSLASCVGSVACIMTRFLFSVVNSNVSWDSEVLLLEGSISETGFWRNIVQSLNGKIYWGARSLPVKLCFSDVSVSGCATFAESDSELVFNRTFQKLNLEMT